MEVLVFIAFPIVVGLILLGISQGKKADVAWKEAAQDLKGRYHKPSLGKRHITGRVDGHPITVSTVVQKRGSSSSKYTRYELRFRKRGLGYEMRREGALSGVAKFFGSQDIEVGEQEFDRAVLVKGRRAKRIRDFLTPERQKAVLQVLFTHPGAVIKDGEISWDQRGVSRSAAQIVGVARRFARLAQAMSDVGVDEEHEEHEDLSFRRTRDERETPARKPSAAAAEIIAAASVAPASLVAARGSGNARVEEVPVHADDEPDWMRVAEGLAPLPPAEEPQPPKPLRATLLEKPPTGTVPWRPPEELEPEPEPERSAPVPVTEPEAVPVPEREPVPEHEHEPEEASPDPADADEHPLSVDDVCEDLFHEGLNTITSNQLFEEHYAGRRIEWSGRLERVESYYSDYVFGSGPGTKVLLVVSESEEGSYSSDRVEVMLQLPEGLEQSLQGRLGETLAFHGDLLRLEGYSRRIHVAAGELA
jgi:hypothetical protein